MRVLVIDDTTVTRVALAEILGRAPGISSVHQVCDGAPAEQDLSGTPPPVVVLNMATRDSMTILRRLGRRVPVVAIAMVDSDEEIIACAEAGASGFLFRDQHLDELVALLESVTRGETRYSPGVAATLLRHVNTLTTHRRTDTTEVRLTPREREVLELIDQGLSNQQISRRLCIELRTTKNHVHNILEKYQVHRRAEAAERYRAGGARLAQF